jgi:hypothetical protein
MILNRTSNVLTCGECFREFTCAAQACGKDADCGLTHHLIILLLQKEHEVVQIGVLIHFDKVERSFSA